MIPIGKHEPMAVPLSFIQFTDLATFSAKKIEDTLTNLDSSCPGSLLKTTLPHPGYPWVSGGRYVTPEPRFSGLVLDHQGLEELELKNHPTTAVFD